MWSFSGADDQQRRALLVLEVDLGRRVQVEVREAGLVEDLAGLGHRVALVGRRGVLRLNVFTNPYVNSSSVSVTTPCHFDGWASAGAAAFSVENGSTRMPFGGAGLIATPARPEAAVEQQLDDQAAERVADQHRRLVELADQRRVVVDDLGQAEARRARRRSRAAPRRRRACAATPARRRRSRACRSSPRSSPSCAPTATRRG